MTEQRDYKNIKIGASTFWKANRLKLVMREAGRKCSYDDLINAGLEHFVSQNEDLNIVTNDGEAAYATN